MKHYYHRITPAITVSMLNILWKKHFFFSKKLNSHTGKYFDWTIPITHTIENQCEKMLVSSYKLIHCRSYLECFKAVMRMPECCWIDEKIQLAMLNMIENKLPTCYCMQWAQHFQRIWFIGELFDSFLFQMQIFQGKYSLCYLLFIWNTHYLL